MLLKLFLQFIIIKKCHNRNSQVIIPDVAGCVGVDAVKQIHRYILFGCFFNIYEEHTCVFLYYVYLSFIFCVDFESL